MRYIFSLILIHSSFLILAQPVFTTKLENWIETHPTELIPIRIEFADNIDCFSLNQYFKNNDYPNERRIKEINHSLQVQANESQKKILSFFEETKILKSNYKSFYIVNLIVAKLDVHTINQLKKFHSISIIDLENNRFIPHDPIIESSSSIKQPNGIENGLLAINAPAMWALGYTGRGRLAYNYDTGVWPTHPAFNERFIGNHYPMSQSWLGFFNPDPNGTINDHGTHTLGTIAGLVSATNDTIGVAFGAYWIANDFVTATVQQLPPLTNMIEAFEWALNPDGDTNTVYDVPDVINNSWRWYDEPDTIHCGGFIVNLMNAIEAAGIANVFSGGNFGPNNTTISSPQRINTSEVNTFSVGSVNGNFSFPYPISSFSSIGPTQCPGIGSLSIHPEVVAPGQNVRSAWGTDTFNTISGTSMAGPHVSGAILLLKEAYPYLTGEELLWALYLTAIDLGDPGEDNVYGMGMIDVFAAFQYLAQTYTPIDPTNSIIDLSISDISISNANVITCDNTFSPTIELINKGDVTADTIDFFTYVNGDITQNYTWNGSITPNSSVTIPLPSIVITEIGNIELNVKAIIRGNPIEYDQYNNSIMHRFNIRDVLPIPFIEQFENGINDSIWYVQNPDNNLTWDTSSTFGLVWNGYSAVIKLFSYAPRSSQKDGLISSEYSLGNVTSNYSLKFDIAYQQRSMSTQLIDTLKIYASTNCGTSFDYLLYEKYDSDLSTLDTVSWDFVPLYTEHWRKDSVDLSFFAGQNIMIKFETTNRQGNNLYLDNIAIYEGLTEPLATTHPKYDLKIYPNPASDLLHLRSIDFKFNNADLLLINSLGKVVSSQKITGNLIDLTLKNLDKGVYFLKIIDNDIIYNKSFIKW